MRICKTTIPISFEKKLVATCTIQRNNKPASCNIYELDRNEDKDYFSKLEQKKDWEENTYLNEANYSLEEDFPREKIYCLENKRKQCLGFAVVEKRYDEEVYDLDLLETCLPYSFRNKERTTKYVGETILSFIAKLAIKDNISKFCVPISSTFARKFYNNCGFEKGKGLDGLVLYDFYFDKLIEQNENHTKGKIELIE